MVKRYEVSEKYIGTGEYVGQMVACSDGDYVEFSDYDALAARLAEVKRILATGLSHASQRNHIALLLEAADSAAASPTTTVDGVKEKLHVAQE